MFVETLTRYNRHSWPIEVKVKGSPVLHANHRSQEGPGALSTKREARQDQVTTMCCENRACKKARLVQKKGGYTCLHFLLCIFFVICVLSDQLYIRSCAVCTGLMF